MRKRAYEDYLARTHLEKENVNGPVHLESEDRQEHRELVLTKYRCATPGFCVYFPLTRCRSIERQLHEGAFSQIYEGAYTRALH